MSKDANIANIVKELDKLPLEETKQIVDYITASKERNKEVSKRGVIHKDRDGTPLKVGDEVYLLTKGADNSKGEKATIQELPTKVGTFIKLVTEALKKKDYPTYIRKLSKSVRKVKHQKWK